MALRNRMDWAGRGDLVFQSRVLPSNAKYLYLCCDCGQVPELIQEWARDLRYCWARFRSSPSTFILSACDFLESHIHSHSHDISCHLASLNPEADTSVVIQEFLFSIGIIRREAQLDDSCRWIIDPEDGEIDEALETTLAVVRDASIKQNVTILSEEQQKAVRTWPDASKINVIYGLCEGLFPKSAES